MKPIRSIIVLAVAAVSLDAHVGSPDVYLDGSAGPYKLFIAIRPPTAIPGIAEVEVRTDAKDITGVKAAPLPMTGPGAKFAPTADVLTRSPQDAQFYTGSLWLMSSGAWQVRITVDGARGKGVLSVPVPAVAQRTKDMQFGLSALLFGLMVFLVLGLVAIVGASVREAQLEPGVEPTDKRTRRARYVMLAAFAFIIGIVWLGNRWWKSEAADYGAYIYKPLQMQASLEGYNYLTLKLSDPGWLKSRRLDDFVPDHNHLMHLYAVRQPGLDVVYHLHPELADARCFQARSSRHARGRIPALCRCGSPKRLAGDAGHDDHLVGDQGPPSGRRRRSRFRFSHQFDVSARYRVHLARWLSHDLVQRQS